MQASFETESDISISSINSKNKDNFKDSHFPSFDPSTLQTHINKKTQRGRKNMHPIPKFPKCSICLKFDKNISENLISCTLCKAQLHISCYHQNIPLDSIQNFTCQRCKESITTGSPVNSFSCFICGECDGILEKNKATNEYYHYVCYRLIPELCEQSVLMEDVTRNNIRKWRYKNCCKYCQQKLSKKKVVMKCAHTKCKDYYHIPCAIEKGMIFNLDYIAHYYNTGNKGKIPFYCSCHNKRLAAAFRRDVLNEREGGEKMKMEGLVRTMDENTTLSDDSLTSFCNNDEPIDLFRNQYEMEYNERKMEFNLDELFFDTENKGNSGKKEYNEIFDIFEYPDHSLTME